ncbi:MAG: tryptophan--tRNA ligase [Acetivibrio sp.]
MLDGKKILFSGMQATGTLTLGNYLGALKNWVSLSDEYECLYGVMDLHSLTQRQEPAAFRKNARNLYALYVAAGLDPEKNCIYYQSHVSGHAELGWILDCFTYMGELNRMTQFKDKSAKHADNINAGLYTYPVLMAADILLYQADVVPIGVDQKQHLEICRDIAERFNNIYGEVFTIPEPYIGKSGAKIMSLQEPVKKMSKSDENINATIFLLDDTDTILRKFKRAVTDSDNMVRYDMKEKPGISNLMDIYGATTEKSTEEIERDFEGKGYGDFKAAVGEIVADSLKPLHQRFEELTKDKAFLDSMIKTNDEKAQYYANKTLRKVQKKVGLTERIR